MKKLALFAGLMLASPLAFAAINIDTMVQAIVYLVIIGLIFWLVLWFVSYVGVPEPFNKVIRVVIGLVALLICISFLLGLAGHPLFTFR